MAIQTPPLLLRSLSCFASSSCFARCSYNQGWLSLAESSLQSCKLFCGLFETNMTLVTLSSDVWALPALHVVWGYFFPCKPQLKKYTRSWRSWSCLAKGDPNSFSSETFQCSGSASVHPLSIPSACEAPRAHCAASIQGYIRKSQPSPSSPLLLLLLTYTNKLASS